MRRQPSACARAVGIALVFVLISSFSVETVYVKAQSQSLPDDATPLQRAIYEALKTAREVNEIVPDAEYLSYGNGTTLTILTYKNGTERYFYETFREIEKMTMSQSALSLPINTVKQETTPATEYSTKAQDILLGFTFQPPKYEWSFYWEEYFLGVRVFLGEGGITIDYGFGLRLPIQIQLDYTETMLPNSKYTLYASVKGLDWSAANYADVGLESNENEFLCFFSSRVWLNILGVWIIDRTIEFDKSRSFPTPIGPEETFPLDRIPIDLNQLIIAITGVNISDYLTITLEIGPNLGSKKITADWKAKSGTLGDGSLLWSCNNEKLDFNVQTQKETGKAEVTLSEFRYWFNYFTVDFDLSMDFHGDLLNWLDHTIRIYTIDLSKVTGSLSIGVHEYTIGTVVAISFVIPEAPLGTLTILTVGLIGVIVYKALLRKEHLFYSRVCAGQFNNCV